MNETNMNNETTEDRPYLGGPRTQAGREASSQNATKHGLCSNIIRLTSKETEEDYKAVEATWFNAYKPKDEAETRLVKQLVDAEFLLDRATRTMAEVEAQIHDCGYIPLNWSDDNHLKLARITRYHTTRYNAAIKARKAIEDYRKNRSNEIRTAEKHEIYKKKSMTPVEALKNHAREFDEYVRNKYQQPSPPPPEK